MLGLEQLGIYAAAFALTTRPFLLVGGTLLFLASRLPSEAELPERDEAEALAAAAEEPVVSDAPESIATEMRVEPLELEIAYDLIDLVDANRGGDLLDRVRALRRKLAMELGIVIPLVRTRDNLELPAHTYAVRVHGAREATARLLDNLTGRQRPLEDRARPPSDG